MSTKYFTIADLYLLLAIDEKYRYVARDKNNALCVFEKRPEKGNKYWVSVSGGEYVQLNGISEGALRCVEWIDDKPTWIPPKKVLENAIAKQLSDSVVMCALFQRPDTMDDE